VNKGEPEGSDEVEEEDEDDREEEEAAEAEEDEPAERAAGRIIAGTNGGRASSTRVKGEGLEEIEDEVESLSEDV